LNYFFGGLAGNAATALTPDSNTPGTHRQSRNISPIKVLYFPYGLLSWFLAPSSADHTLIDAFSSSSASQAAILSGKTRLPDQVLDCLPPVEREFQS
jgi:hypothetical protein